MARGLKLSRAELQNANHWYLRAFRLKVTVEAVSGGMDPFVFLFRRAPADAYTGTVTDYFMTVASPVDMAEYPAGEPDASLALPYFRTKSVELDVRSVTDFEAIWETLRREVAFLVAVLDQLDLNVKVAVVEWLGTPPPGDNNSESISIGTSQSL